MKYFLLVFALIISASVYAGVPWSCADPSGCPNSSSHNNNKDRDNDNDNDTPSNHDQAAQLANGAYDKIQNGNLAEAERDLIRSIALDPDLAIPRYNYAWILSQTSRCKEAIGQAQIALRQEYPHPEQIKTLTDYCQDKLDGAEQEKIATKQGYIRIGGTAEVEGDVFWITNTGKEVRVEPGRPLFLNTHIRTRSHSRVKILLLDGSYLIMHSDSDMILDEFVYDPDISVRKVSARLIKGIFRFVTAKVARPLQSNSEKIHVLTGTIGIRGTDVSIIVGGHKPVQGCDSQNHCKDYNIVASVKLESGAAEFTATNSTQSHPITTIGGWYLITEEGLVIDLSK